MNKKGFTLVELLAVIVILALLALVANSSVTNVVRNSKSDLYNAQIELIESAAKTWGIENLNKLPEEGMCSYIKLKNLKKYGLLENDVVNPKTNKSFSDDMYIKITSKVNSEGALKTIYEVDANNVSSCIEVYPDICKLAQGKENEIGSKYECEVKPDVKYNFYVLSQNNDGSTNLIMDRNINSDGTLVTKAIPSSSPENGIYNQVAWVSQVDYNDDTNWGSGNTNKGPITAMNFLHNATKDWINIPNINFNYEDNGTYGYGGMKTTNNITEITMKDGTVTATYENLKARLPYYSSEVSDADVNNLYLYEYLQAVGDIDWKGPEGKQPTNNISGIYGYWTLSSDAGNSNFAIEIHCNGYTYNSFYGVADIIYGVRPVITLEL